MGQPSDPTRIQVTGDSDSGSDKQEAGHDLDPTHTEAMSLVPSRDGQPGQLHTFKLAPAGQIVAGVSFHSYSASADKEVESDDDSTQDGTVADEVSDDVLQVFSPDLELIQEIPLDFPATAIAIAADGTMVVGGNGQVAKFSANGEMLISAAAPHLAGETAEQARQKAVLQKSNFC